MDQKNQENHIKTNQKLDSMLKEIHEEKPHLKVLEGFSNKEDIFIVYLKGKLEEIQRLKKEIDLYSNEDKHFTRQYRTLEGHCGKLQTDLDKVDAFAREDLRALRKSGLIDVNNMFQVLKKKVHPSGAVCTFCEVQK